MALYDTTVSWTDIRTDISEFSQEKIERMLLRGRNAVAGHRLKPEGEFLFLLEQQDPDRDPGWPMVTIVTTTPELLVFILRWLDSNDLDNSERFYDFERQVYAGELIVHRDGIMLDPVALIPEPPEYYGPDDDGFRWEHEGEEHYSPEDLESDSFGQ